MNQLNIIFNKNSNSSEFSYFEAEVSERSGWHLSIGTEGFADRDKRVSKENGLFPLAR